MCFWTFHLVCLHIFIRFILGRELCNQLHYVALQQYLVIVHFRNLVVVESEYGRSAEAHSCPSLGMCLQHALTDVGPVQFRNLPARCGPQFTCTQPEVADFIQETSTHETNRILLKLNRYRSNYNLQLSFTYSFRYRRY